MKRTSSRHTLRKPYFASRSGLPCQDFNKEIIPPGANAKFPKGVVGLRVDDDFWAVAALPYRYRNVPTGTLVRHLWPQLRFIRKKWKPSYDKRISTVWKCNFNWASYWSQNRDEALDPNPDSRWNKMQKFFKQRMAMMDGITEYESWCHAAHEKDSKEKP